jgi:hypothetical protein
VVKVLRRVLTWVGRTCLMLAKVNRMEAQTGDDPSHMKLAAVIYVFDEGPATPMLLAGMAQAYGSMRGVQVNVEAPPPPDEPPAGTVH